MPNINVPYQPVPQGQATPATPFMGDVATPQAFGVNIGRAEEQLGQTMDRASSALEANVLQIQGYKTEAEVNSGVTDYILGTGDLTNKFRQLPGSQAQDQLQQHINDLNDARQKIRARMSSPKAQRDFDNATMHRFALDVVNSSQYAATQMRQFTKESYDSRTDAEEQRTIREVNNGVPGALKTGQKRIREIQRDAGKFEGQDPDTIDKRTRDRETTMFSKTVTSRAKSNPAEAYRMLAEAEKDRTIDAAQINTIRDQVDNRAIEYYTTMDGAEIANNEIRPDPIGFAQNPEGGLARMDDRADEKGKERYPDDPVLAQRLTNSLKNQNRQNTNLSKQEQAQKSLALQNDLTRVVDTALPTGRKPINEQEANMLDPTFSDRFEEAKRRDYRNALRIEGMFKANAAADNLLPPAQIIQAKQEWAGMTNEEKQQVRPADLFNKKVINRETMDMMVKEQTKMKALSVETNEADSVLQHYSATLNDKRIFKSQTDADANRRYIHLRGALQLRIADEQARLGRPVKMWTTDEQNKIVNQIINDVDSGEKSIIWGDLKEPAYEQIYRKQVAPEMPAFVKEKAPSAEWNMEKQQWETIINGIPVKINVPPEAKK